MEQKNELAKNWKKRKWLWSAVGFLLFLVITNPSMKQFEDFIGNPTMANNSYIKQYEPIVYHGKRKMNFFLCSVYQYKDKEYFGILGNFFKMN